MNEARLLDRLARDHARLREVAARDLAAPVPNCPQWTVRDLARHVANGYVDVVVRRLRGTSAGAPREDLSGEEPLAVLGRCYAMLTAEFGAHDPGRQVGPDPAETVRFWIRRMAHETLIHRMDVEGALLEPIAPANRPNSSHLSTHDELIVPDAESGSPTSTIRRCRRSRRSG